MTGNPHYLRHDRDEWYDEVRIETVPRYKMSDLSGDEWRTSARVQILRKGFVLYERGFKDVETAAKFLPSLLMTAFESDEAMTPPNQHEQCFQPGCKEVAVSEYRLKKEYCRRHGHEVESIWEARRRFCQRHLRRGDCGIEDSDRNYEVVSGPGPESAKGWGGDVSESAAIVVTLEQRHE